MYSIQENYFLNLTTRDERKKKKGKGGKIVDRLKGSIKMPRTRTHQHYEHGCFPCAELPWEPPSENIQQLSLYQHTETYQEKYRVKNTQQDGFCNREWKTLNQLDVETIQTIPTEKIFAFEPLKR